MENAGKSADAEVAEQDRFETTCWTAVLRTAAENVEQARAALDHIGRSYWRPLYSFARRRGYSEPDAQDLTQGFFAHFLAKDSWQLADPARGRFRTFLLISFQRFMAGERSKAEAIKRGGKFGAESFASSDPKRADEPAAAPVPVDESFDREWAEQVFAGALERLRLECGSDGQRETFARLREFLTQSGDRDAYARVAETLGLKPDSVAVAVHRLRRRYGELVRAEVLRTVGRPEDLAAELNYLIEIMSR